MKTLTTEEKISLLRKSGREDNIFINSTDFIHYLTASLSKTPHINSELFNISRLFDHDMTSYQALIKESDLLSGLRFNVYDTSIFMEDKEIPLENENKISFQLYELFKRVFLSGEDIASVNEENNIFTLEIDIQMLKELVPLSEKIEGTSSMIRGYNRHNDSINFFKRFFKVLSIIDSKLGVTSLLVDYKSPIGIMIDTDLDSQVYYEEVKEKEDNYKLSFTLSPELIESFIKQPGRLSSLYLEFLGFVFEFYNLYVCLRAINDIKEAYVNILDSFPLYDELELDASLHKIHTAANKHILGNNLFPKKQFNISENEEETIFIPSSEDVGFVTNGQTIYLYKAEDDSFFIGWPIFHEQNLSAGEFIRPVRVEKQLEESKYEIQVGIYTVEVESYLPENYLDILIDLNIYADEVKEYQEIGEEWSLVSTERGLSRLSLTNKYQEFGRESFCPFVFAKLQDGRLVKISYEGILDSNDLRYSIMKHSTLGTSYDLMNRDFDIIDPEELIDLILNNEIENASLNPAIRYVMSFSQLIWDKIKEKGLNEGRDECIFTIGNFIYVVIDNFVHIVDHVESGYFDSWVRRTKRREGLPELEFVQNITQRAV